MKCTSALGPSRPLTPTPADTALPCQGQHWPVGVRNLLTQEPGPHGAFPGREGGSGGQKGGAGHRSGSPRSGGQNTPSRGRRRRPPSENAADRNGTEQGVLMAPRDTPQDEPPRPATAQSREEGRGGTPSSAARGARVSLRDTGLWGSWGSVTRFAESRGHFSASAIDGRHVSVTPFF